MLNWGTGGQDDSFNDEEKETMDSLIRLLEDDQVDRMILELVEKIAEDAASELKLADKICTKKEKQKLLTEWIRPGDKVVKDTTKVKDKTSEIVKNNMINT